MPGIWEQGSGPLFRNRREAGCRLAEKLREYRDRPDVLVLALPRGGVPAGFELARELNLPLDVFLVRKLGVPWQPELAMGAVASGGVRVLNQELVENLRLSPSEVAEVATREEQILREREQLFRGDRPPPAIRGRTVIIVDDGLATGSSMRAAVSALRQQGPARVVIAAPISSAGACADMAKEVDEVVCLATPEPFWAVGQWYVDFAATSDQEVHDLLAEAKCLRDSQVA